MKAKIRKIILSHIKAVKSVNKDAAIIEAAIKKIAACLKSGGKLLICGNGGSAADAQHMAAEFVGRFKKNRKPLAAISLSTDTSILTCLGNDFGFKNIFAKQIQALAKKEDILIVISTSGNSLNLIEAVKKAKELKIQTIGILGKGGGRLKNKLSLSLLAKSQDTPRIQEIHSLLIHTICELAELNFA
ncbi:MAG: SIS domain-containing protein [Candidatus Omnitrophica bacterium]|nr:SIS domain-containing protein [Candidatus Omnitrophota bacterium]